MFEHLFAERGLSLDRLKTLIEVAKAGSIAAAARGDSARQSLYSRQIKELEEFFGVELASRRGKVLALTGAGWELVRLASESLCLLDDFKSRSRNLPYRFTIGAGDSLHAWVVAPVLASIQKRGLPWLFALENLRNSEIPSKRAGGGRVGKPGHLLHGLCAVRSCSPGREKGAGEEGGFSPPAGNVPPSNAGERFRVSCVAEKELR